VAPQEPLTVILRAEWGAAEPVLDAGGFEERAPFDPVTNQKGWLVYDEPLHEVLNTIVVHHSALPLSDGPREIQRLHVEKRGFADIGYHFLIDDAGRLYEGRSVTVRGAHTGGFNTGTLGVVLLGNFEFTAPTEAQIATLKAIIAHLADRYAMTHVAGHRDFQPEQTKCPGRNLAAQLPDIAAELGLQYGTGRFNAAMQRGRDEED
jgi:hypothetical protein